MRRRKFIALVGGTAAWPLAAAAQQSDRMRRIGVMIAGASSDPEMGQRAKALEKGLRELGWVEGRNLHLDYRWPDDIRLDQHYAEEIVGLAPDVILVAGQPALDAMRRVTRTIPIVFVQITDPVGGGAVASLARPGGNLTGFANETIGGKWLELLKEIAPRTGSVAVMLDPASASNLANVAVIQAAASSLGTELIHAPISQAADIERAFDAVASKAPGGVIVLANPLTAVNRASIIALAARHRLPAVYSYRWYVTDGGLMSYGVDTIDLYRRAASYLDRVLKGAAPAELPVQLPTKFELVLNLKTAKALGVVVPPMLLARADEVIE
jgi:putative ABC transport system substrate-binding protein